MDFASEHILLRIPGIQRQVINQETKLECYISEHLSSDHQIYYSAWVGKLTLAWERHRSRPDLSVARTL